MTVRAQWVMLRDALDRLCDGASGASEFAALARAQHELRDALGPRYAEVLDQLLDRLEASALFAEESCSFSQRDLLDGLRLWMDKAGARLIQT